MKVKPLLIQDIKFQYKYGFYFLYLVFSVFYITLLYALPVAWREKAAILMIFSDPAAMGLFFMGAIVLFEKGERVLDSIAVSPAKPYEYMLSKLVSIGVISTVVALVIGFSGGVIANHFYFIAGVFLCSCLFSSVGIILAAKITTLNQFILATIPAQVLINIPAIAYLFGWKPFPLLLHPGVCMIELCENGTNALPAIIILILWVILVAVLAEKAVAKMLRSVGGFKL